MIEASDRFEASKTSLVHSPSRRLFVPLFLCGEFLDFNVLLLGERHKQTDCSGPVREIFDGYSPEIILTHLADLVFKTVEKLITGDRLKVSKLMSKLRRRVLVQKHLSQELISGLIKLIARDAVVFDLFELFVDDLFRGLKLKGVWQCKTEF